MKDIHVLYISISGNTRAFVKKLTEYAKNQQANNPQAPKIISQEIHLQTTPTTITTPFFAFVPTYLEGGNGIDNGDVEILTEPLRNFLRYQDNATYCLGVIGSGNRNFNHQYCLTAKQYAEEFQVPMLADFELRGTNQDVAQIYQKLVNACN